MKKCLFFLLVIIAIPVYAQENIAVNLNIGNIGFGRNIPLNDNYSSEAILTLLNIGIEHQGTNIGMEFSPFTSFNWMGESDTFSVFSFLNFNLHWNILNSKFWGGVIYFGPFTSMKIQKVNTLGQK
jgi:hypothetical protein